MVNTAEPSRPLVDEKSAAFSRLVSRVLETLNEAVQLRKAQGVTLASIADRMNVDRSSLSRSLNGTSKNLTLKTVSNILWATDFEPKDFAADPIETICPNWHVKCLDSKSHGNMVVYEVINLKMDHDYEHLFSSSSFSKPILEEVQP